jgi:hypothetical protein
MTILVVNIAMRKTANAEFKGDVNSTRTPRRPTVWKNGLESRLDATCGPPCYLGLCMEFGANTACGHMTVFTGIHHISSQRKSISNNAMSHASGWVQYHGRCLP